MQEDLLPYRNVQLDAVMAAHVIYECIDCNTAVFSNKWIDYLRNDIKFDGVVFTDDLSMAGAGVVGDMLARVQAAWAAGCDMLLVCNSPESVALVLDNWQPVADPLRGQRVLNLLPRVAAPDLNGCGLSRSLGRRVEYSCCLTAGIWLTNRLVSQRHEATNRHPRADPP
jgi:beta-N-acetylhexosaminidase